MSAAAGEPDLAATVGLERSPGPGRWLSLIGLVLLLAFAGVAWVQSRSLGLLNETVAYQGDNLVWSFYQLETEALRLRSLADDLADRRSSSPDELRERYEIFVSRISLIEPHRTRQVLPDLPGQAEVLAQLQALVTHADPLLAEGAPAADEAVWRDLVQRLQALTGPIRSLSLQVNQAVAEQVTRRNDAVRQQSRIAIGLTVFQSLLTLVFAVIVVRQLRALHQRRRHLEQLAQHLQEARAEAEQASRAKSAFLANMSHELRTPFNGLLGMLSLIEASPLDAQQRAHLVTARESGLHLLSILNDVLDLSTLESGRLEMSPAPVDLHRLLQEVVALMGSHARAKALQLRFELAPEVPRAVHADGKRLKQILFNLLGNAVKFTAAGEVALQVSRLPRQGEVPERLRLRVTDTGIGMDETTLRQLFQRFSQGDASIQRRYGGTGLGLEISRSLARLMGGDIEVASRPGEGSRFDVLIALHEMDEVALPVPPLAPLRGGSEGAGGPRPAVEQDRGPPPAVDGGPALQVLVTDDHPVNRQLMQAIVQRLGHVAHLCENGAEAVAWLREHRCDLVLMDVHMPVMDGLAATRAIRALAAPACKVPIVALTADAFDAARQRALEAGMNDFMAKPVQVSMVEELLRRHARQAATTAPQVADAVPPPAAPVDPVRPDRPGEAGASGSASPVGPAAAAVAKPARLRLKRGEVGEWLDLEGIAEICVAVGLDGYRGLLGGLLAEPSDALVELQRALAESADAAGLRPALHKFKGAAASLGLKRLAATARQGEQQAAQGDLSAEQRHELSQQLQAEFERSRALCLRVGYLAG